MKSISYIVLYVKDIEKSMLFYQGLGLSAELEKHGGGPRHYSIKCGSIIIELYPAKNDNFSKVRIGLLTTAADKMGIFIDPDGNTIDVTTKNAAQQGDAPEPATNADPASRTPPAPAR